MEDDALTYIAGAAPLLLRPVTTMKCRNLRNGPSIKLTMTYQLQIPPYIHFLNSYTIFTNCLKFFDQLDG